MGPWKLLVGSTGDGNRYQEGRPGDWLVGPGATPLDKATEVALQALPSLFPWVALFLKEILRELRLYLQDTLTGSTYCLLLGQPRAGVSSEAPLLHLFNLESDPQEKHNVVREHPQLAADMLDILRQHAAQQPHQYDWKAMHAEALRHPNHIHPQQTEASFWGPWLPEEEDLTTIATQPFIPWFVRRNLRREAPRLMLYSAICVVAVWRVTKVVRVCCSRRSDGKIKAQ